MVYQEIEDLSRKLTRKTKGKSLWRALKPGEKAPKLRINKDSWARVMDTLIAHLDPAKCPKPDRNLLIQIAALTSHRNDTGHKPSDIKALIARDQRARTRFEHAIDLLADVVEATRPLRL